jgi:hypothetical protein
MASHLVRNGCLIAVFGVFAHLGTGCGDDATTAAGTGSADPNEGKGCNVQSDCATGYTCLPVSGSPGAGPMGLGGGQPGVGGGAGAGAAPAGPMGLGGSDPMGLGGAGPGAGGSGPSNDTCTLNGAKFNCPDAAAAQKCFDTGEPGTCTAASSGGGLGSCPFCDMACMGNPDPTCAEQCAANGCPGGEGGSGGAGPGPGGVGGSTGGGSCADFCGKFAAQCGDDGTCMAQCGAAPPACQACIMALPDICSVESCAGACTGGPGAGGAGGAGPGPGGVGGSNPGPGAGGAGVGPGAGGSAPSAGGAGGGAPQYAGACRKNPSPAAGGSGGSGGAGGGTSGATCSSVCAKVMAASCEGGETCPSACSGFSQGCVDCVAALPNVCDTTACNSACSGGGPGPGPGGSGGSSAEGGSGGAGGAGPMGMGGSGPSNDTCTLNGAKFNCPDAAAAQKCFDTGEPGTCTSAG